MAKQAKGRERLGERHKAVLATEAKPAPAAKGALVRSARMSTAGTLKDLTAHHAISVSHLLTLLSHSSFVLLELRNSHLFLFFLFFSLVTRYLSCLFF